MSISEGLSEIKKGTNPAIHTQDLTSTQENSKCQLVMATGGTVSQDLTMQWSTMSGCMQDLSLMVVNEGQQFGTDREIATISLLRNQPLILWTGDAQQTPGGLARAAPNAKRSGQRLLTKQHGLRNRRYFMPSTLAPWLSSWKTHSMRAFTW